MKTEKQIRQRLIELRKLVKLLEDPMGQLLAPSIIVVKPIARAIAELEWVLGD